MKTDFPTVILVLNLVEHWMNVIIEPEAVSFIERKQQWAVKS